MADPVYGNTKKCQMVWCPLKPEKTIKHQISPNLWFEEGGVALIKCGILVPKMDILGHLRKFRGHLTLVLNLLAHTNAVFSGLWIQTVRSSNNGGNIAKISCNNTGQHTFFSSLEICYLGLV